MRHLKKHILYAIAVISLTACDEGRIYDDNSVIGEEGGSIHLTAITEGTDTWPSGYTLAVAGFADGNGYALVSKNIGEIDESGKCDVTLNGIPSEVSTIELCALDRLRRRIATFHSTPYSASSDTQQIELSTTNMSMTAAVQKEIFNTTCTNCHGGSGHAAANLDLTEGKSVADLVMQESVKIQGLYRVKPGNSAESVLYLILGEGESANWSYDHSVEVVRQEKLDLIRNWIDESIE